MEKERPLLSSIMITEWQVEKTQNGDGGGLSDP